MKEGINFATRAGRGNRLAATIGWVAFLVALAGTAMHLLILLQARSRVEVMRVEMRQNEERVASLRQQMEAARRFLDEPAPSSILKQLMTLHQSGAPRATSPPAVLSLLAEALPWDAKITSVRLQASPPQPELRVEARADSPHAASQLLGELAASSLVARAEILEERHLENGEIHLSIGALLSPSEDGR